jgi:two-component system CheB/CheR fusion protein
LPGGDTQHLNVVVAPLLDERGEPQGVTVAFQDVTTERKIEEELHRVSQERETAFEELQSTNEELETTNEELQSTVEELETTNEELQSTNEEMETMNEELQSTNEELQTMNDELRERTEEANRANAFLESILTGLNTGVAVLDSDFRVHAWNRMAEELWGVRADEVVNEHFLSLDIGLPVERLKEPIHCVAGGEVEYGEEVLQATTRRGKSVTCRVTLTPLRDDLKALSGVILLMEEWLGSGQEELKHE